MTRQTIETFEQARLTGGALLWEWLQNKKNRSGWLLSDSSPDFNLIWECQEGRLINLRLTGHFIHGQERVKFSNTLQGETELRRGLTALGALGDALPWVWSVSLLTCAQFWPLLEDPTCFSAWLCQLRRLDVMSYLLRTWREREPEKYAICFVQARHVFDFLEEYCSTLSTFLKGKENASELLRELLGGKLLLDVLSANSPQMLLPEVEKVLQALPSVLKPSLPVKEVKCFVSGQLYLEKEPQYYPCAVIEESLEELQNRVTAWHKRYANKKDLRSQRKAFIVLSLLNRWETCQQLYWSQQQSEDLCNITPLLVQLERIGRQVFNEYAPLVWEKRGWLQRALQQVLQWLHHLGAYPNLFSEKRSNDFLAKFQKDLNQHKKENPILALTVSSTGVTPAVNPSVLASEGGVAAERASTRVFQTDQAYQAAWSTVVQEWLGELTAFSTVRGEVFLQQQAALKKRSQQSLLIFHPDKQPNLSKQSTVVASVWVEITLLRLVTSLLIDPNIKEVSQVKSILGGNKEFVALAKRLGYPIQERGESLDSFVLPPMRSEGGLSFGVWISQDFRSQIIEATRQYEEAKRAREAAERRVEEVEWRSEEVKRHAEEEKKLREEAERCVEEERESKKEAERRVQEERRLREAAERHGAAMEERLRQLLAENTQRAATDQSPTAGLSNQPAAITTPVQGQGFFSRWRSAHVETPSANLKPTQ